MAKEQNILVNIPILKKMFYILQNGGQPKSKMLTGAPFSLDGSSEKTSTSVFPKRLSKVEERVTHAFVSEISDSLGVDDKVKLDTSPHPPPLGMLFPCHLSVGSFWTFVPQSTLSFHLRYPYPRFPLFSSMRYSQTSAQRNRSEREWMDWVHEGYLFLRSFLARGQPSAGASPR
jgi:hypothetical protein